MLLGCFYWRELSVGFRNGVQRTLDLFTAARESFNELEAPPTSVATVFTFNLLLPPFFPLVLPLLFILLLLLPLLLADFSGLEDTTCSCIRTASSCNLQYSPCVRELVALQQLA